MEGKSSEKEHLVFLLRCWQEANDESNAAPAWHFSLVEAGGEQRRRGFASLQAAMTFIEAELTKGNS
jgi:hypothetical protein